MSEENAERVRAGLEAYNRKGPEAIIALVAPDVEWIADRSDMGRLTYRGRDGVRKSFEDLYESFDRLSFDVEELIEEGNQIVVLGQMHARGRGSGVEVQGPLAIVFKMGDDGQLVRYESFRSPKEALEAAGLSKQDAHADS